MVFGHSESYVASPRSARLQECGLTPAHHLQRAASLAEPTCRRMVVPARDNRPAAPWLVHALVKAAQLLIAIEAGGTTAELVFEPGLERDYLGARHGARYDLQD